jgi:hypothetical protein
MKNIVFYSNSYAIRTLKRIEKFQFFKNPVYIPVMTEVEIENDLRYYHGAEIPKYEKIPMQFVSALQMIF